MIYFTADTHFNHANIIKFCNRPFSGLEEMHETMIARWNESVSPGDVVYHLGDFALSWGSKNSEHIGRIFRRLNGQKFLLAGNHDRKEVLSLPWVKVTPLHEIRHGGRVVVLCHYPLRSWRGQHRGSWMLHGHCHGGLTDRGGRIMDVGVDVHDFRPVSIDAVERYMAGRYFSTEDHHDEERP